MAVVAVAADGDVAAMGDVADLVLELDGGVVDVEVVGESAADLLHDLVAFGKRDVGDGDVRGKRVGVGANAPDVQVVDAADAADVFEVPDDVLGMHAGGHALEKNVEGLAQDAERGPQDERGDADGERRVN